MSLSTSAKRACEKLDRFLAEQFKRNGEECCAKGGKIGAYVGGISIDAAIEVCKFFEENRVMPLPVKGSVKAVKDIKRVGAYRVFVEYEIPAETKPEVTKLEAP